MSNYHSSFHVIDVKLDNDPSLTSQRSAAANEVAARSETPLPAARCTVEPISEE